MHNTRVSRPARRGITLVEMLISMAVTLVMMAAVVNLFANIGSGVRNRRASMELGSQLRLARARLFKDLAGATCPARPKLPSDDHDDGYFEIIEGQWSDKNPSILVNNLNNPPNDPELEYETSIIPGSNAVTGNTDGGALGDYDDILALTVRSESEPFVGRAWLLRPGGVPTNPNDYELETVESDLAEVIWYAVESPGNNSPGEPGMRTVYRRVLLIAPWVEGRLQPTLQSRNSASTVHTPVDLLDFYRRNDISVRRTGVGADAIWIPNTLSSLTKRQHRFGHFLKRNGLTLASNNINRFGYPYALDLQAMRANAYSPTTPPSDDFGPLRPFGPPFDTHPDSVMRQGEDVMLNDVLAFDLRVYDPGAPLYQSAAGIVLEPSDLAWADAYTTLEHSNAVFDAMVGQGAYVDLGYVQAVALPDVPPNPNTGPQPTRPVFHETPNAGSRLNFTATADPVKTVTYDTWSFHYENDGIDQSNRDGDNDLSTGADEGTDGLDTNNAYGVDDALEREAPPPYDHALRAMQAIIRVYDRESRQIRQATVTRNFVPQ